MRYNLSLKDGLRKQHKKEYFKKVLNNKTRNFAQANLKPIKLNLINDKEILIIDSANKNENI